MTTLALGGRSYAADFPNKRFVNTADQRDTFPFIDFELLVALTKFAVRHIPHFDGAAATHILLASQSFDAAHYLPASPDTKELLAILHARSKSAEHQPHDDAPDDTGTASPATHPDRYQSSGSGEKIDAKRNKLLARRLRDRSRQRIS